jgi:polysaccharide pyruvyl transferase WcaK-like protein
MKISFIGYYGGNFGDLLMLSSLIDYYSTYYEIINIFTYGNVDILKSSFTSNSNFSKINIYSLVGEDSTGTFKFTKLVNSSRYLIWGGGTCFMDQSGTGGVKYMMLAKLMNVSILYLGVGIDSHKKVKTKLYVFLAVWLSKTFYCRDTGSLFAANQITFDLFKNRVKFVPDIANIKGFLAESVISDNYVVYCCRDLSNYESLNNDEINLALANLTVKVCKSLGVNEIINLVCDVEIDLEQSEKANLIFFENDLTVITVYGYNMENSLSAIYYSQFIITSRLHPAVVSHNLNIPYALYNYSDKNEKFLLEVNEISRLIDRNDIQNYIPVFKKPSENNLEKNKQIISNVLREYIN